MDPTCTDGKSSLFHVCVGSGPPAPPPQQHLLVICGDRDREGSSACGAMAQGDTEDYTCIPHPDLMDQREVATGTRLGPGTGINVVFAEPRCSVYS